MSFIFLLFVFICVSPLFSYVGLSVFGLFCFDSVSLYLTVLSLLLILSLIFFIDTLSFVSCVMLVLSIICSILSYCCVHSFWFWCFYEMSILPLLLLIVIESPYSERYVASWYLLGYAILSSLPMLLCLIYLSFRWGAFEFGCWPLLSKPIDFTVLVVLGVLFIIKIPLPPFHVWLPLVHAEATSPVSVCLSGYVMKLGILGLCRICSWLLPDFIFTISYLVICLIASFFFFLMACCELDSKRWLAFMSLSHIVISCACLGVAELGEMELSILYCLGHGLSAGLMFIVFWVSYEITGSRNWFMLKSVTLGGWSFNCLFIASMCTVMSFPPTIQFLCEVFVAVKASYLSLLFLSFFGVYLFLSGLIPLFMIGGLLSRHVNLRCCVGRTCSFGVPIIFLLILCFLLFMFC